jgi:hypothetical protein
LIVESFVDPSLTGSAEGQAPISINAGRYDFIIFNMTPLYFRAFLDTNGNHQFDQGKPTEIYRRKSAAPGDAITPGPDQGAIDFTFGDTVTTSCIGDCNNDSLVTIDELLALVSIGLGNAGVGECLAGNANDDMQITIDEILIAVNNALNGCAPG